jgi:hypothetical protein
MIWDFSTCKSLHSNINDLIYPRVLGYFVSFSGNYFQREFWQFNHQRESLQTGIRGLYPGKGIFLVISYPAYLRRQLSYPPNGYRWFVTEINSVGAWNLSPPSPITLMFKMSPNAPSWLRVLTQKLLSFWLVLKFHHLRIHAVLILH